MNITIVEQKDFADLINQYNSIDPIIIKKNLIRSIDNSQYHKNIIALAEIINMNINTIYGWRQVQRKFKVSFESALKISNALGISITDLMNKK